MGPPGSAQGAAEVSDHVAGSKRLNHFCKVVSAVESLSKNLLSLAECALVSNVERLRDLHHDKQWPTAEVKKLMGGFQEVGGLWLETQYALECGIIW